MNRTERMESPTLENQEMLDSILASLDDVVWSVAPGSHEVIYQSPAAHKVYGYPAQAFRDNPNLWAEVVHPDDYARVRAFLDELLVEDELEMEYRIIRPDGEVRWLHDRARVIRDAAGQPLRFDGIASDVTRRRQMEDQLRLWGRAIESSFNAFMITDALQESNPITYVNPAFERITGYRAEEVLGKNPSFLQNDDRDQHGISAIRTAAREQRDCRVVLRNYRKDGSMFWNELIIAPVRDESGKVAHFRAHIREAFNRYEIFHENERLAAEVMHANEALSAAKRALEATVDEKTREAEHDRSVLRVSQEMLQYLPLAVIGVDEDGVIVVSNRKAERLFGMAASPLVGQQVNEALPAEMAQCALASMAQGMSGRHPCRLPDGGAAEFWCHPMGSQSASRGAALLIMLRENGEE